MVVGRGERRGGGGGSSGESPRDSAKINRVSCMISQVIGYRLRRNPGFDELCSSNGFTSSSTITSVLPGSPISC